MKWTISGSFDSFCWVHVLYLISFFFLSGSSRYQSRGGGGEGAAGGGGAVGGGVDPFTGECLFGGVALIMM